MVFLAMILGMHSLSGTSQDTTKLFLDGNFMAVEKEKAVIQRKAIIDKGIYHITDQFTNGKMIMYGEYSSINPWIENGTFKYYNEFGKLYATGGYKDGLMSGNWIYYEKGRKDSINYDDVERKLKKNNYVDRKLNKNDKTDHKIHTKAEVIKELYAYIDNNLHFPPRLREICRYEKVIVLLSIEEDNQMMPEIMNSKYQDFNYEILRILLSVPDSIIMVLPRKAHLTNFLFAVTFDLAIITDINKISSQSDTIEGKYINPTEDATFQGGDIMDFREYVQRHIVYPPKAIEKGQFGRLGIQFTVNREGGIDNIKILKSTGSKALDNEAVRVISNSPRWIPANNDHKTVNQLVVIPVIFMIR